MYFAENMQLRPEKYLVVFIHCHFFSLRSTKLLAQTTLRNILGTKTLAEMLSDREAISLQMQVS